MVSGTAASNPATPGDHQSLQATTKKSSGLSVTHCVLATSAALSSPDTTLRQSSSYSEYTIAACPRRCLSVSPFLLLLSCNESVRSTTRPYTHSPYAVQDREESRLERVPEHGSAQSGPSACAPAIGSEIRASCPICAAPCLMPDDHHSNRYLIRCEAPAVATVLGCLDRAR